MKNIENFAISDAALEQVAGGVEVKSSKIKKALTYTGLVLGGGLALAGTACCGAYVGEKYTPYAKAKAYWEKMRAPKAEEAKVEAPAAPVEEPAVAQ